MLRSITILFAVIFIQNYTACAQWSTVGFPNELKVIGDIQAMCLDHAGNLYVGGGFLDSNACSYVAKWDGTSWTTVGPANSFSQHRYIYSMCSDPAGNIYAAGDFINSNGKCYVAKWDGANWVELAGANSLAADNVIYSICSDPSGNIYAAGDFKNGAGARYVAKWDGNRWSQLGGITAQTAFNADSIIRTLCCDTSGNIYAGGDFNDGTHYFVAKLNATTWSSLPVTDVMAPHDMIAALCTDPSGNVYASGLFVDTSISSVDYYVAKFNGAQWDALGGNGSLHSDAGSTTLFCDASGNIYTTRHYYDPNGQGTTIAKFDGSTWSRPGGPGIGMTSSSLSMCTIKDAAGTLYTAAHKTFALGSYFSVYQFIDTGARYYSVNDTICSGTSIFIHGQSHTQSGTYTDTVIVTHGADSVIDHHVTVLLDSLHLRLTILPSAQPHHWYVLDQSTGTGTLSYIWSWGDQTPNDTTPMPSHIYADSGFYTICLTISNDRGCSTTLCDSNMYIYKTGSSGVIELNVVRQIPTGILPIQGDEPRVYPNPTSGSFTIENPGGNRSECVITDILGQVVLDKELTSDLEHIKFNAVTGVYTMVIKTFGSDKVVRLIVQ